MNDIFELIFICSDDFEIEFSFGGVLPPIPNVGEIVRLKRNDKYDMFLVTGRIYYFNELNYRNEVCVEIYVDYIKSDKD